jgi:DNA repair/transcription protein MET18/MMS19
MVRYLSFRTTRSRYPKALIVLKNMGDRFLSGYIALADGEKDPRNLMVTFAIARVLAIEFDISSKFEVRFVFPHSHIV